MPLESPNPSKPRAPRWLRVLSLLALLGLAIAAVWWIDRGVLMPGGHSTTLHGS